MRSKQLSNILNQLGLDLDIKTRDEIKKFINSIAQPSQGFERGRLHAIAAIAIKAEIQRMPAIGEGLLVRTGLSLELFLQHIKGDEKFAFLEKLHQVGKELKNPPIYLIPKIDEIYRRYDIFKRYRSVFEQIISQIPQKLLCHSNVFSILWMINIKAKQILLQNAKQDRKEIELHILFALLSFALPKIASGLNSSIIESIFRKHFKSEIAISKQKQEQYDRQFSAILAVAISIRHKSAEIEWNLMSIDQLFLNRLVDDFSNLLSRRSILVNDEDIDELSFLQLNEPIAPQPKRPADSVEIIQAPINYVDFQGDFLNSIPNNEANEDNKEEVLENPSTPILHVQKSPENNGSERQEFIKYEIFKTFYVEDEEDYKETLKRRKKFIIENSPTRFYLMNWIQDAIKTVENQETLKGYSISIEELNILREYEVKCLPKMMEVVEKTFEACRDKNHRARQIFKFFVFLLGKVKTQSKKEDFDNIIKNEEYLHSFLCITTMIFNHAYRAEELSFVQYCENFNLSLIRGFVPLNSLGRSDMPKQLQIYLYEVEQRILFEEVWKTDLGRQIFSSKTSNYLQLAMKKRTYDHINHQILRVCQAELTDKERHNLFKFIEEILSKKVELLRHNNLYIIFICSIVYCHGKTISLNKINDILRKNQKMAAINLQFKDPFGNSIAIGEYYETYFLKEMQPLILSTSKKQNFISPHKSTPKTAVRQQIEPKSVLTISKYKFGIDSIERAKNKIQYGQEYDKCYLRIAERLKQLGNNDLQEDDADL